MKTEAATHIGDCSRQNASTVARNKVLPEATGSKMVNKTTQTAIAAERNHAMIAHRKDCCSVGSIIKG